MEHILGTSQIWSLMRTAPAVAGRSTRAGILGVFFLLGLG